MIHRSFAAGVVTMALVGSPLGAWAQNPPPDAPSTALPPDPPAATAPQAAPSSVPEAPLAAPPPASAAPRPYLYPSPYWRYPYPAAPAAPTARYWYGWQTLLVMGGSTVLSLVSTVGDGRVAMVTVPLAIGGFTLGGPIVHWAQGNIGKGFISLGMNVGGAVLGAATGAVAICAPGGCAGEFGPLLGFLFGAIGGGLGLLAANIVDVSVLSYREHRPARPAPVVGWRPSSLVPTLAVQKDRMSFGLQGTF
jgi:hypothetical protein